MLLYHPLHHHSKLLKVLLLLLLLFSIVIVVVGLLMRKVSGRSRIVVGRPLQPGAYIEGPTVMIDVSEDTG